MFRIVGLLRADARQVLVYGGDGGIADVTPGIKKSGLLDGLESFVGERGLALTFCNWHAPVLQANVPYNLLFGRPKSCGSALRIVGSHR